MKNFYGKDFHTFVCVQTGKVITRKVEKETKESEEEKLEEKILGSGSQHVMSQSSKKECDICTEFVDITSQLLAGLNLEGIEDLAGRRLVGASETATHPVIIQGKFDRLSENTGSFNERDQRFLTDCLNLSAKE